MLIGVTFGYFKIFDNATFTPHAVKFVFYVALPCLVINALGIKIDLYDDSYVWTYISAFLILRVIALIISFIAIARSTEKGIGQVAVLWLTLTWISTVILGAPICGAVFDNPNLGRKYGVLAAISSFIFQLPFQLLFLECHSLEKQEMAAISETTEDEEELTKEEEGCFVGGPEENSDGTSNKNGDPPEAAPEQGSTLRAALPQWPQFARRKDIWVKIVFQILQNPVICGIACGFFLTLTTIGPRFLNSSSDKFVPGLGWISTTLQWLGDSVSPLSLFVMGLWMHEQGQEMFRIPYIQAFLYMLSKLVLVPLLMVALAKFLDLDDEPGRAAVLIAALPISMASFSLAHRYEIGEDVISENVALGTALVTPTIILWNLVMDATDIFPID